MQASNSSCFKLHQQIHLPKVDLNFFLKIRKIPEAKNKDPEKWAFMT
jgi:hypothetical protein